ncbi:MAG: folylpolyglutamate synthase/dihydrofolate synthase family protein [Actinomycetota bacterium]
MRFDAALAELEGRQPDRIVPTLDRIRAVATLLGDPQLTHPSIHVTGTNGKTTTARAVTELACAHGITSGLYTSPHLLSVTERLQICDREITVAEFGEEYERLLPVLQEVDRTDEHRVTYFEVLTALAFLWFADAPVGLGVYEVGMGGRWDATTVCSGDVAVIGEIGLDHPELGATIAEVAGEKAAIIKQGKTAVVRDQAPDAMRVVQDRCNEVGATLVLEGRDYAVEDRTPGVGGQQFTVRGRHGAYEDLYLPMFGDYAARNCATAIAAVECFLDRVLDPSAVDEAMRSTHSPGRLEVLQRHPLVVLDGAHNPAGAEGLAVAVREVFAWDRLHLVIAVSANKDLGGIVAPLAPLADRAYAAAHDSARSQDAEVLFEALAVKDVPSERFTSVAAALDAAQADAAEGDLILVTGSLYTVADARRALGP